MYENFYGFREKPFSLLPDPAFLFRSKQHDAALTLLQYGLLNQAGFTVITGDVGCGKTTLIRYLIEHLETDVSMGIIDNTNHSLGDLLQWILLAFGLEYSGKEKIEYYHDFVNFVAGEYAKQKRTVLIVDEAQNLSPAILEELRMLSNINTGKDQMLQLILVGQPKLCDTLQLPELHQFWQRVHSHYFLGPLDAGEIRQYIRHRISLVGGKPSVFRRDAYDTISRYTRGIPRLINLVCDTALVYGYAEQRKTIDARIVEDVLRNKSTEQTNRARGEFGEIEGEPFRRAARRFGKVDTGTGFN